MNIYAALFVYKRPVVLGHCLRSIYRNTLQPDRLDLIDNASGKEVDAVIVSETCDRPNNLARVEYTVKEKNMGAADSFARALAFARANSPKYFFPIESDYVFRPWAFETVLDVFENTPQGKMALGIIGYDHPNGYSPTHHADVFPRGMREQVGEDNVNRAILFRPFWSRRYALEFASNTCPTCYLNWHRIIEIAAEFPELNRLLDEVHTPRPNPNYPTSEEYLNGRLIDDGMLSHAISLCWNRWAIKHGIDRTKFGAWLNIKPSIANCITGGGVHSKLGEMETEGGSPSWVK